MAEVVKYKGVFIQVTPEGKFYADPKNNSTDFYKASITSDKVESIKKAIDNYTDTSQSATYYYDITNYRVEVEQIFITNTVGTLTYYSNGKDSRHYMGTLYLAEIENTEEFQDLMILSDKYKELTKEIKELENKQKDLTEKSKNLVSTFRKFIVRL